MQFDQHWTNSDGEMVPIHDLTDDELHERVRMVKDMKKFPRLQLEYERRGFTIPVVS